MIHVGTSSLAMKGSPCQSPASPPPPPSSPPLEPDGRIETTGMLMEVEVEDAPAVDPAVDPASDPAVTATVVVVPSKQKTQYKQKYTAAWERVPALKGWLSPVPGNKFMAGCRICNVTLHARKKDLMDHCKTKKHQRCQSSISYSGVIAQLATYSTLSDVKDAELRISAFTAEHYSLQSCDHLADMISKLDPQSDTLKSLKLHRTKCTRLITNVLAPSLHKELVEDICSSAAYYSLIIDERTDVSCENCLCLLIKYYSTKQELIITTFYRLLTMKSSSAEDICKTIMDCLQEDELPIERLIGVGVDGASMDVGCEKSISMILKESVEHVVVFRCICRSLHLAGSKASEALPNHLEYLVRETYNWFFHNKKHQLEHKDLFKSLNSGENPLKMTQTGNVRWLGTYEAVSHIVSHWDTLSKIFEMAKINERCFLAEQLHRLYTDSYNKQYLVFLKHELMDLHRINKLFQMENTEVSQLNSDLVDYHYGLLKKLVAPHQLAELSPIEALSLNFENYIMPSAVAAIGKGKTEEVTQHCMIFLCELLTQVRICLPENVETLQFLDWLTPRYSCCELKESIVPLATRFSSIVNRVDDTELEWRLLPMKDWSQQTETVKFWAEVYNAENAVGEKMFVNISSLALAVLSLPFSNVAMEREFSVVNKVKSKQQNRMQTSTMEAIIQVRCGLAWRQEDCSNFTVTKTMLEKFTNDIVYKPSGSTEATEIVVTEQL
ncbi:uncharacterized protein LOC144942051 [Lampetra fluviatilis]